MKRLLTLSALAVALVLPTTADAHNLTCAKARELARHSNAVSCWKSSPNHAWLNHPNWRYPDHVYWAHEWSWWCVCHNHRIWVVHQGHGQYN